MKSLPARNSRPGGCICQSGAVDSALAVHDALDQLAVKDARAAELVRLRFFAGMSVEQAAEVMGLPRSTAYVHWAYAKASLRVLLDPDNSTSG